VVPPGEAPRLAEASAGPAVHMLIRAQITNAVFFISSPPDGPLSSS